MADLKPFIKKTVNPGEPLTAQAWNDVVEGIDGAYQFLQAFQHTVRIQVTNPGLDLERVRVTAVRAGAAPVEAVRPVLPDETEHVLSRLEPGGWTVKVETAGFDTATKAVNVPEDGAQPIPIALQQAGSFMPDLFGSTLAIARQTLADAGIHFARLFDFNGRELPPLAAGENDDKRVLVQWPPPDSAVPKDGGARLVIGVPVQVEPAVAVPALASLTQVEAQRALEAVGLVLGKVSFVHRGGPIGPAPVPVNPASNA
jgi:hypothetical protein